MKLIAAVIASALGQYDPNNVQYNHHNGCLFPTPDDKAMISNDPNAQFTLSTGSQADGAYSEGSEVRYSESSIFY